MLGQEEKTVAVEKAIVPEPIVSDATNTDKASDGFSSNAGTSKPDQHMSDDEYPHGFRLVLLAGASLVAVFLIALDQVSDPPCDVSSLSNGH